MTQVEHAEPEQHPKPKTITIHIDRAAYKVEETSQTGLQIRAIPVPPISADLDLYLVVPGPGDDILVGDNQTVELREGTRFFTAPRVINPGQSR